MGIMLDETIPNYRILEKLGEGGMGTVYLAEQQDPIHRKVALKVIKLGMDSKEVIARFETERQALAMMNHVNIARVFDAGTTMDGRPYFAMEHVPGIPLNDYCDRNVLPTGDRLELFVAVCRGTHHAHQKGVIHRDLKPSNILVMIQDDEPVPKIIDFGVAKALSKHLTNKTLHTHQGRLIGTPAYMSPEQAEMTGLNVDTTADVYSLGVILYELLVGELPLGSNELLEGGVEGMQRMIREKTPSRPSTRLSEMGENATTIAMRRRNMPMMLQHQLRGDLDWITMKALEKDSTRRYQSASEFAEDIRRYLHNEPVSAGPPSSQYRLKKFIQRNKVGVTAGLLIVLALLIGLAGTTLGIFRAKRAEELARQEAAAAEQVSEFMVGLFEVSDPSESRGNSITAREILDEGARDIRERLSTQPLVKARLMHTMGNVYQNLGLYKQARPLLKEALSIRDSLLSEDPELANSMTALANLLHETGDYEAARPLHEEAIRIWKDALGPTDPNVARGMANLGNLLKDTGDYGGARSLYEQSLAIREETLGPFSLEVSVSLNSLANLLAVSGDYEGALPLYRRAISIKERHLGIDHPDLAMNLGNLANVLFYTGDYAGAEQTYRRVLSIQETTLGADHPLVAVTMNNLGELLAETGNFESARPLFERAGEIWKDKLGSNHPHVALGLHNLAKLGSAVGEYEQAEQLFLSAQRIWEEKLGPDHPNIAENLERHAELLWKTNRPDKAAELEARAHTIRSKRIVPE
jgi:serine/threonine protein kinase